LIKTTFEGSINLEELFLEGIQIGNWKDIMVSVINHSYPEHSMSIIFSGIEPEGSKYRKDMAQIYIDADGHISLTKPVLRPEHDHDDCEKCGELCEKDSKDPVSIFPKTLAY
jgi:hypothetical protein